MYIYKTTNNINGKIYIGQSHKIKEESTDYFGSGFYLKRAIKKNGKENFKKEVLEECLTKKQLNEREIYWISFYNSIDKNIGYNIALGGQGGMITTSEKLSKAIKEKQWSGEKGELRRKKHSDFQLGSKCNWSKKYKIIDNEGNEFIIDCLKTFAIQLGVTNKLLRDLVDKGWIKRKGPKDTSFFRSDIKGFFLGWKFISLEKKKNTHSKEMKKQMSEYQLKNSLNRIKLKVIYDSGIEIIFNSKKQLLDIMTEVSCHKLDKMLKNNVEYNYNFKIQKYE